MTAQLLVLAGPEAKHRIHERGFSLDLFDTFIGASGGPKWIALCGLDEALAEPLSRLQRPIQMIGSSIGAARIACYAQIDAAAAFNRFLKAYISVPKQRFDRATLNAFIMGTIDAVLSNGHGTEILNNKRQSLHIVTARCRGLAASARFPQLGMLPAALVNAVDPTHLGLAGVTRAIFVSDPHSPISLHKAYPGDRILLTSHNLKFALRASGAIPGLTDGVSPIPGAPPGVYRDGGIVDYHFDLAWHRSDGLILYPHFASTLVPGWFDKFLHRRHLDPSEIDRVVVLTPSPEFVDSLPYGKIPDRSDASTLAPADLHEYWSTVAGESGRLGEALNRMLETGDPYSAGTSMP